MRKEILRMNNVITEDPNKTNLCNFNLHICSGEIMGLIGINEYGKEKLIELISRNTAIKFGTVYFREKLVNRYRHSGETENKVYILNAASKLVEDLSVIDNVFVLKRGFGKYVINKRVLDNQLCKLQQEFGTCVDPRALCGRLTEYQRCVVEILKAVVQGVKLIIINDISSSLSVNDLQAFQNILFYLAENDYSILYIGSHHEEVFPICHRAVLMKDGKIVKLFEKDEMKDENIEPYTIPFEDTKKEWSQNSHTGQISFCNITSGYLKNLSFDANAGECIVLYDRSKKIQKDSIKVFTGEEPMDTGFIQMGDRRVHENMSGREWFSQIAVIEENPIETMIFYHMNYIDNLCFLLDNKSRRIHVTNRVKRSIKKEYFHELGEELYENNLSKLEKTSLYNLIYYRIHLLNPKMVFIVQPFSHADMYVRRHTLHLIRVLKRKGIIVIILAVTISDSLYVADKFILLENGEKKREYVPDEFGDISYYI